VITITDTGLGMSESEIERIFDAFAQGDHAEERNAQRFGGLGLGLAISKLLVEQHGGRIEAKSPGLEQGSTIRIDLPLSAAVPSTVGIESDDISEEDPDGPSPVLGKPHRPMRILLIEDHEATRDTLALLLRRRGHTVVEASTIEAGMVAAADGEYDLLMSDIGLPDGRGDELMTSLRENGFEAPAIALSGYGMESDLLRSRQAGFGLHLTKPVSIQELDRALARVL
jgi:CheY-like chemotaxis protein